MSIKNSEKMTPAEIVVFCLMATASGVMIGIGGASSLLAISYFADWGKLVGGVLFSLGIYAIIIYEMRLFTGMISDIPTSGKRKYWQLPLCFLFNTLGVILTGLLAYYSPIAARIVPQAQTLIGLKLSAQSWGIKAFCSATLCGMLITLSVKSVNSAPQKGLSATVGVLFPIIVFAFCGFDHSVANMLYFYYLGEISFKIVGYIALTVVGNIVGGVALPYALRFKAWAQRQKQESQTEE